MHSAPHDSRAKELVVAELISDRSTGKQSGLAFWAILCAIAGAGVLLTCAGVVTFVGFRLANAQIQAEGELRPLLRQDVFVPCDSGIETVYVRSGDHVDKGEVLVRLHSDEIQLERERIESQLLDAQERLLAAQSARLRQSAEDERFRLMAAVRAAEAEVEDLKREQAIAAQKLESLSVRSPLQGQVIIDDSATTPQRPVLRGEQIMTIVDGEGGWGLELQVEESRLGGLLKAQAESGRPIEVRYQLATDPVWRRGVISEIPNTSDATNLITVRVEINEDDLTPGLLRPGTAVHAVILLHGDRN